MKMDPLGLWSVSVDLYSGLGGGVTFGIDDNGEAFGGGRLGFGFGGGASLAPNDNGPKDRNLKPNPYGKSCELTRPNSSGTSVGTFAKLGIGIGPYGYGVSARGGRHFDGTGMSYSQGPKVGPGFNPLGGSGVKGVSFGGAAGMEVIGW